MRLSWASGGVAVFLFAAALGLLLLPSRLLAIAGPRGGEFSSSQLPATPAFRLPTAPRATRKHEAKLHRAMRQRRDGHEYKR